MNRPRRRKPGSGRSKRGHALPMVRSGVVAAPATVAALRRSRMALQDIEGQLGKLLVQLRGGARPLDAQAPDRLRAATAEATAALASLAQFRDC